MKEVAEATSDHETLHQADAYRPALVLMDVQLPRVAGLQIGSALGRHRPDTCTIVLSMYGDEERLFAAIRVEAAGFLTKDTDRGAILEVSTRCWRGELAAGDGVDKPKSGPSRPRRLPLLEGAFGAAGDAGRGPIAA